jgi:hypothetical protein
MFERLMESQDPHQRGYLLEELLRQTFDLFKISVSGSFRRNQGAEQIDGAFEFEGWHYIVECRWRKKPAGHQELDGFLGPIIRSGKQTMGLFLSINGWSDNVPEILKENPNKVIILMNGDDLRIVLDGKVDLKDLIREKRKRLNIRGEPFYGAEQYLKDRGAQHSNSFSHPSP